MLVVISKFTVTLDGAGAVKFAVAADNLAPAAVREPGCKRFDVCNDPAIHGGFALVQYYVHQAAFDGLKRSGPYKAFSQTVAGVITAQSEDIYTLTFSPTGP